MTPSTARTVRSVAVLAIMAGIVAVCLLLTLGWYFSFWETRGSHSPPDERASACLWSALVPGVVVFAGLAVLLRVPRPPPEPKLPAARIVDR